MEWVSMFAAHVAAERIECKVKSVMNSLNDLNIACEFSGSTDSILKGYFVEVFNQCGGSLRISTNKTPAEIICEAKEFCNK